MLNETSSRLQRMSRKIKSNVIVISQMRRTILSNVKPHSHCADVATVHPDAGQPVYRDAPGHISYENKLRSHLADVTLL